jgi:uncharacterized protein (DUF2141 family)
MKNFIIFLVIILGVELSNSQEMGDNLGPFSICGNITGFKPGCAIKMALYATQEDFKARKYTKANRFPKDKVIGDTIRYCLHGIREGEYIIVIFQDLNNNGDVNTNFLGIPTEPYLFYQPIGNHEWPSFTKSKFRVNSDISNADFRFSKR